MSGFNFGTGGTSGGFTLGAAKTSAPTGTTGFSFGTLSSAPSAGFSFGAPQTAATTTTAAAQNSGLFSFSTSAPAAAATSGFSLGTPATTASAVGGLMFGNSAPKFTLNTQTGNNSSTGTTQPTQNLGFTFGTVAPQAQPASSGGFGIVAPQTQPASSGGFGTVAPQTQPASSGGFGTVAPQTQPASSGGFGTVAPHTQPASSGGFGTVAPQTQPASSGGFGTVAPQTQPASSGGFGTVAPQTQPASLGAFGTSTPQTQPASSGGFGFSSQATTNIPSTAATVATTTAQSGFAFQSPAFSVQSAPTTALAAPTQTTAVQQPASLFSKPPEQASVSTAASTASASSMASLLATSAPSVFSLTSTASAPLSIKPQTTGVVQTSTSAAASSSLVGAPVVMNYGQLENLINKWSLELEDQEKHFLQQATQVNAWDRMLIHNGERITTLHREMEKVKMDQKRLDQELDFILAQQKELEDILTPLEESVKEQQGTIYLQHADEEREKTFKLAENIDAQLKRMAQDLKDVIEHLNTSTGPGDTSNPLQQICKILNAHMGSLQWIEQNSSLLQRKVEQVTKECESRRKEQERGFPITFD